MGVNPLPCLLLSIAFIVFAIPGHATATLVLSRAILVPQNVPLAPLQELRVDAGISIIPSGARTFATGHSLQLETDLSDARWSAGVVVDGIPAAQQGGEGRVIFVNGFVLSYPTYQDVAVNVTVEGTVPRQTGPVLMVLRIQELDNSGLPVPGDILTVNESVSPPATSPAGTVPGVTITSPSPSSSPTEVSGFLFLPAMAAAGAAGTAYYRCHRRKRA